MSPEDRVQELFAAFLAGDFGPDKGDVLEVMQAAILQEREACCLTICTFCADGDIAVFNKGANLLCWQHNLADGSFYICSANGVRERTRKEEESSDT